MKLKHWLCLFSMAMFLHANAQQFGGFPPSTRWKQIDTDTARIIFTKGAEWQANRIATILHKAAADTTLSLGNRLRKINVVLQSRTTLANGYVALAPYRSEFYLVPGSNIFDFGNLPWYEQLALHEYRHVQQYNNFRHGVSKGAGYLFGEQGVALATALAVPDWFFEGDAVHTETALTPQGRGRQAFFLSGYNSLWLLGRNYNWHKLRNGSLKDYVPNHYQLGYLLTNYGYLKYGDDFWKKVTQDASAFKGVFYPFQAAVKRHSGVNYKTFRKEALEFYKSRLGHAKPGPVTDYRTVTNMHFPQLLGYDSVLYLKKAYNRVPGFYILDRKGEHRVSLQHISSEEWFSHRNGTIAYTAFSTHPRWTLVDYSDIVLLDVSSGKETRITEKQRYFTPDLSPSGERIVAVKMTDSLKSELHLLSRNGDRLKTLASNDGELFVNPRFADESRVVVGLRKADARISLQLIDLDAPAQKPESLLPDTYSTVGQPFVRNDTVFFVAGFQGNDDIYALRLKDKKLYRLTWGATGNYYPSVFGGMIGWSRFTAEGLQLQTGSLKSQEWAEVSPMEVGEQPSFYPVAFPSNILNARTERFSAKRYSGSTGLFNFHSWSPAFSDPEFTFSLYGDNVLNTFSNEIFYRYNQNENSHGFGWNTAYGGLYPVLSAGAEYTYKRELAFGDNTLTLDQLEARVGYNIPLNFTRGTMYKFLDFGSNFVFNRIIPTGFYKDSFEARNRTYLHHYVSWQHYLPRAVQHIYPKFGYTLTANVRHFTNGAISNAFSRNAQWLLGAQLFLPSIRNHSLVISGAYQSVDTFATSFANRFSNSRGYGDFYSRKMWRVSGNYHFPIVYPDIGLASIVYLQRLRGNIFFDYSRLYGGYFLKPAEIMGDFKSVGIEFFFDTKWWNQLPVSFGIRMSHLLDNGPRPGDKKGTNYLEIILPVGLIPR